MAGVNKVMVLGRLGADPETKYTRAGSAVTKISVATSEKWNDKNTGQPQERTEWHRVTFFGKQAETIGRYMKKGSMIFVEGKLQTSSYEKDGITRYNTDIIASNFQFINSKNDVAVGGTQPAQNSQAFNQPHPTFDQQLPDGDIPF